MLGSNKILCSDKVITLPEYVIGILLYCNIK